MLLLKALATIPVFAFNVAVFVICRYMYALVLPRLTAENVMSILAHLNFVSMKVSFKQ